AWARRTYTELSTPQARDGLLRRDDLLSVCTGSLGEPDVVSQDRRGLDAQCTGEVQRIETTQADLRVQARFAELVPRQWGQRHAVENGGDKYLIDAVAHPDPAKFGL